MRGTKRAAISDSAPLFASNDPFSQSKRVTMGLPFDALKAEQSSPQLPLDAKRAESSKQHVRALNTQFASWVQAQLQSHPDELWEDGVQDYLNHAKSIMDKFSDVVNWLKANATKESLGKLRSNDSQTKHASDADKSNHKLVLGKPGFPSFSASITPSSGSWNIGNDSQSKPASEIDESSQNIVLDKPGFPASSVATTPSFGSWPSANIFVNNAPFSFGGNQVLVTGSANAIPFNNNVTSSEADGEEDIEQPGSPSVKKSQEEGIVVVHEVKCKLYVKSNDLEDKDTWKDKGMGQLNIKCKEGISKGTKESKPVIVIRNDVGKLLLNASLYPGIKTNKQKNSVVAIFHTSADCDNNDAVVARTFLMRTKTQEDRDKLAAAIQEYAPAG